MQTSPRHREYWQKNLRISAILLAIWFVVTYVVGFYARDLKNGNPFSPTADVPPVQRGRAFLAQFSGVERVYQFMLSAASKKTVNYNRDIAGSAQAVLNNRDVPGGFTKEGYTFMQDALRRADQFFGGERWVLCDATGNVPATTTVRVSGFQILTVPMRSMIITRPSGVIASSMGSAVLVASITLRKLASTVMGATFVAAP